MNTFKTCAAIFLIAFPVLGTAKVRVTHLTVNYLQNPLGIDELPNLSWQMQSDERGISQTAYQIQVAASKEDLAKRYLFTTRERFLTVILFRCLIMARCSLLPAIIIR